MLHPYKEAARRKIPLTVPWRKGEAPGQELLPLLQGINGWLGEYPTLHKSLQDDTLYLLYRDAAFPIEDFWDAFGAGIAAVSDTWPLWVFGTAPNQETVRLSAHMEGEVLELIQHSISGKKADMLETLCLQLDCGDPDTGQSLFRLLSAMDWEIGVAALSWEDADFLQVHGWLMAPQSRGLFCYAGGGEVDAGSRLLSLGFLQKTALWTAFLKNGFEPEEFEWLAGAIANNDLPNRMEWELALWDAMEQLGFRVVNQDKAFALYDGAGRRLYFGADCRRAAERSLLKILFPLNYA